MRDHRLWLHCQRSLATIVAWQARDRDRARSRTPVSSTTSSSPPGAGMLFAYRNMTTAIDERLEREHELSLSSYEVLLLLSKAPDNSLRMGDLADQLLLSRSGLTRLVDRLVARGLLERHTCTDRPARHLRTADRRRPQRSSTRRGRPTSPAIREQFVEPARRRRPRGPRPGLGRLEDRRGPRTRAAKHHRWPTDSPARPPPTSSSTRTTPSTGSRGARRRTGWPVSATSRSCSRSATRPATGAT